MVYKTTDTIKYIIAKDRESAFNYMENNKMRELYHVIPVMIGVDDIFAETDYPGFKPDDSPLTHERKDMHHIFKILDSAAHHERMIKLINVLNSLYYEKEEGFTAKIEWEGRIENVGDFKY